MKVLMGAYACFPGRGSEPGAGWEWARAAAEENEVWVLTHATNAPAVIAALIAEPGLEARLHPVFLQNPSWVTWLRGRGPTRFVYYLIWQLWTCAKASRALHRSVGFDVAHHVTYGADWMPCGVSRVRGLPFVWGPVGGASTTGGARLWRRLGGSAWMSEAVRAALLVPARRTIGRRVARRAAVVLGQNPDVVRAFRPMPVRVEPHMVVDVDGRYARSSALPARQQPVAVFAGRLLAWKGVRLVLDALRRQEARNWRLAVYGDGPQREALRTVAHRWGVSDRVDFLGARPRDEVLRAIAEADALVLPSIHDSAGWVVAEAQMLGCPVVCLDLGGPPSLLVGGGVRVKPSGDVVGRLAEALDEARRTTFPPTNPWTRARLVRVLADVYRTAGSRVVTEDGECSCRLP